MAGFIFSTPAGLGAVPSELQSNITMIRIPCKDGSWIECAPPSGHAHFQDGDNLGVAITDERALRFLTSDPRFTQV